MKATPAVFATPPTVLLSFHLQFQCQTEVIFGFFFSPSPHLAHKETLRFSPESFPPSEHFPAAMGNGGGSLQLHLSHAVQVTFTGQPNFLVAQATDSYVHVSILPQPFQAAKTLGVLQHAFSSISNSGFLLFRAIKNSFLHHILSLTFRIYI